jgi:hypothetical protein
MNRQELYDDDLLRKYLNPEKAERAPEGFTSKTLTRIRIEVQSGVKIKSYFRRNRVPLISSVIIGGLFAAAVFLPAKETDVVGSAIMKFMQDIQLSLPHIKLTELKDLSLPGWIPYAYLGILLLGIIDWAVSGVFHRQSR